MDLHGTTYAEALHKSQSLCSGNLDIKVQSLTHRPNRAWRAWPQISNFALKTSALFWEAKPSNFVQVLKVFQYFQFGGEKTVVTVVCFIVSHDSGPVVC